MNVLIRKRKSSSGKTRLFLEIYYSRNNRKYESLNLSYDKDTPAELRKTILEAAKRKRHDVEKKLLIGEYDLDREKRMNQSFINYFQGYSEKRSEKSPNFYNFNAVLLHLKAYTNGHDYSFKEINKKFFNDFKDYLLTKVKASTVNNYLNKISITLNRAIDEGLIQSNPMNRMDRPDEPENEKVFLTEDEIKLLMNTECHYNEVKRAFLFACFTGMRFSDVRKLTWGEIKDGKIHFCQKKTGGFEYIPLSETASNIIYSNNQDKIIPLPNTKVFKLPVNHRTNMAILIWVNRARIDKHITFHSSRHTFATLALTKGADLYTVSKLLGHRDIMTTQIYAKIVDEKKEHAMKSLPVFKVTK